MNRKEAERVLIAEAIKRGSIAFLVSQKFDPTYFEPLRNVAEGLWRKVQQLDGLTPSLRSAQMTFPDFDFTPVEDKVDLDEAANIVRDAHVRDEFNRTMMKLKPMLQKEGGYLDVMDSLPLELTKLKNMREDSPAKDFALDAPERHEYVVERAKQRESGSWKVNFAHSGLNDHFGGYEPGYYMYVARTGVGKTWTCLLDLWWSWYQGANVGIFSLEMDFYKVGLRLDTFESHFSNYDLNKGITRRDQTLSEKAELDAENEIFKAYLELIKKEAEEGKRGKFKIWPQNTFKNSAPTPRRIEALIKEENLDFVVIDQLELVSSENGGDERTRLNDVAREFKLMAGRLNIPILVPHQMNRETLKAKEVTDANIAGSDGPAKHADFICYLTRDQKEKVMFYNFLKGRNAPTDITFALKWDWDDGYYKPVDPDLHMLERKDELQEEDENAVRDEIRPEVW